MCAACKAGYQGIGNLFNLGSIRTEITKTISSFFYSVRTLGLDPLHLVRFYTLLRYLPPPFPLSERTYILNDPYMKPSRILQVTKRQRTIFFSMYLLLFQNFDRQDNSLELNYYHDQRCT